MICKLLLLNTGRLIVTYQGCVGDQAAFQLLCGWDEAHHMNCRSSGLAACIDSCRAIRYIILSRFICCRDKLFPESAVRNVIYQVLQGLAFMHKHGKQVASCHYPPWKGDIVFGLSLCPSVRPGRFFSHFVRVTPSTVFITHKQNLYHLKAGCLVCVMGWRGPFFGAPPKFWRDRSLKTVQNHKFQFLERHKSKNFGLRNAIPIPYESPASFV